MNNNCKMLLPYTHSCKQAAEMIATQAALIWVHISSKKVSHLYHSLSKFTIDVQARCIIFKIVHYFFPQNVVKLRLIQECFQ